MAYDIKTKKHTGSVAQYIQSLPNDERRKDAATLMTLMKRTTKKQPKLWGASIVGFGSYSYETQSKCRGEWPLVAFSPRKNDLSVYIMPGFKQYGNLMKKLGPHKHGVSCLYIKRLSDVDLKVLEQLVRVSYVDMQKMHASA
jgi:hypothetical protein